jgi:CRP-like cAMP-binding protein
MSSSRAIPSRTSRVTEVTAGLAPNRARILENVITITFGPTRFRQTGSTGSERRKVDDSWQEYVDSNPGSLCRAGPLRVRRDPAQRHSPFSVDSENNIYPPRTLGPGEIAGLPATLTGHYSLTARVTEDAELGFIPGPRVTEILQLSPHLCMMAMRLMSEEIARVRTALRETPPLEYHDEQAPE